MSAQMPSFEELIPLFPLPNVVLFPQASLPLQIFEPRYRTMVSDALENEGLIAMALLRPGYEAYYHTNLAAIAPVVCVGRIREHVKVDDGRYFINLVGICRARVIQEYREGEYRLGLLEAMWPPESAVETDGQYAARRSLEQILVSPAFASISAAERCRQALGGNTSLSDTLDMIAAGLLPADNVEVRQILLEETDVLRRASLLSRELQTVRMMLESQARRQETWPHLGSNN